MKRKHKSKHTATRRIFVGDVQGCREELEELLDHVRFDAASDALHPVGDLINRGPDSLGCLRLLRGLDAGGVLGNHDVHVLRVRAGLRKPGRGDTLDELIWADDCDALLAWLAERPFALCFDDVIAVHAGLHPRWKEPERKLRGLDPLVPHPASDFATRVRYCDRDGARPKSDHPRPPKPFAPWYRFYDPKRHGGRTVVFGHWALGTDGRPRAPVHRKGVRGLDTGCVWGGELSAWIPEEDRIVSVPARRSYASLRKV